MVQTVFWWFGVPAAFVACMAATWKLLVWLDASITVLRRVTAAFTPSDDCVLARLERLEQYTHARWHGLDNQITAATLSARTVAALVAYLEQNGHLPPKDWPGWGTQ